MENFPMTNDEGSIFVVYTVIAMVYMTYTMYDNIILLCCM